ncbi:MAG: hypothetical protein CVT79_16645 [Alphaproteobacteria bacterium HGW-Alphaproteobacteria-18]|nr:MAG: hypothetical protein CVT79_16645 [Alphaproteobacteria bacterium HGW-Alphaproteobacteria-18]
MAEAKSKEQLEAEWWERWRAEDFTWEGLKSKPLEGWVVAQGYLREAETGRAYGQSASENSIVVMGRGATLQDYWRASVDTGKLRTSSNMKEELVEISGQPTFHCVHLPFFYEDDSPTEKAEWENDFLDSLIGQRLFVAHETLWMGEWFARQLLTPDGRAQFQGCVLLNTLVRPRGNRGLFSVRYEFAYFAAYSSFDSVAFAGDTYFSNALFYGEANFESASFSGNAFFGDVIFLENSSFLGTTFSGHAYFDDAQFSKEAAFFSTLFMKYSSFSRANFKSDGQFVGSVFSGNTSFDYAKFTMMRFHGVTFEQSASFLRIDWPQFPNGWHTAFEQAIFRKTATFRDSGFRAFAAFDGAIFERGVQLDETSEVNAERTFRNELLAAIGASVEEGEAYRKRRAVEIAVEVGSHTLFPKGEFVEYLKTQRDARLRELERGCRVLKLAMEKASNKSREQMLHRFELKARRAQNELRIGEKFSSYLYGWTSDYGASIVRPVLWLGALVLIFGLAYWGFATGFRIDPSAPVAWSALAEALSVSASRVFPFGAFEWVTRDWMAVRQGQGGPGFVLVLRLLATLQTLLALGLVFLFGLAIRRRFQIS